MTARPSASSVPPTPEPTHSFCAGCGKVSPPGSTHGCYAPPAPTPEPDEVCPLHGKRHCICWRGGMGACCSCNAIPVPSGSEPVDPAQPDEAAVLWLLYRVRDYWEGVRVPGRDGDTREGLLSEIHDLIDPDPAAAREDLR